MKLGSRTVERMLAANFGIEEDRLIAFRGRLDHLRRRGCPTGVNTGKGKAAVYDWPQIIELALALSLLDLGLSPEQASAFVQHNTACIYFAVGELVREGNESGELLSAAQQGEWPIETSKFLLGQSFALAGLTPKGKSEPGVATFVEAHSIADSFRGTHDVGRSVFLIDMGTKVASLVGLVAIWGEMPVEQVIFDLEEWSHDILEELLARVDDIDS